MTYHKIKYYPVGNGDTTLITLADNTKILIDINITDDSTDDDDDRFDVLRDLLEVELNKDDKKPFTDAFILTHPDIDHCRGFEQYIYQGNPDDYSDDDESNKLIVINELWYTPRVFDVFTKDLNSDAKVFKKEAKRRMDLFKKDPDEADKDGNRIRIVGYSDNSDLKGLEDRLIVPGNSITEVNGVEKDDYSMFIHAPFKKGIDGADPNNTSIVFQSKFSINQENCCKALFGGDAGWRVWKEILDKSEDEDLNWDIFLAPHHCSWGYFNDSENKDDVQQSSIDVLDKKIGNDPKVIASCKVIVNNDDNPPSYAAKTEYVKIVGEDNFWSTASHSETTPSEPIEFEIKKDGPQESSSSTESNALKSSLITKVVSEPKTYG